MELEVADSSTGKVQKLIEERSNVWMSQKPVRLVENGKEIVWWSERDGWGHYYLYGADGTLKNQIDKGEYVAEDVVWAKLAALREGADIASRRLWGKG